MGGSTQGLSTVNVKQLEHMKSSVHGKTRRGGQSQNRYQRTHGNEKLEFAKKVAERVHAKLSDVQSLILAGPGDMKDELKAALPQALSKRMICPPLSISCNAGPHGLNQAAMKASHLASSHERKEADNMVQAFFEKSECTPDAVCYGEEHTRRALETGAIESLLIAEAFESAAGVTFKEWAALAEEYGTNCFKIVSCVADSVRFCSSFRIAGILRYALDDLVAEQEEMQELTPVLASTQELEYQESEESSVSSVPSDPGQNHMENFVHEPPREKWQTTALGWLTDKLPAALDELRPENGQTINESDALALTECVALLLEDETEGLVEGLSEATDILLNDGISLDFVNKFKQMCVSVQQSDSICP